MKVAVFSEQCKEQVSQKPVLMLEPKLHFSSLYIYEKVHDASSLEYAEDWQPTVWQSMLLLSSIIMCSLAMKCNRNVT